MRAVRRVSSDTVAPPFAVGQPSAPSNGVPSRLSQA